MLYIITDICTDGNTLSCFNCIFRVGLQVIVFGQFHVTTLDSVTRTQKTRLIVLAVTGQQCDLLCSVHILIIYIYVQPKNKDTRNKPLQSTAYLIQ